MYAFINSKNVHKYILYHNIYMTLHNIDNKSMKLLEPGTTARIQRHGAPSRVGEALTVADDVPGGAGRFRG